MPIVKALLIVTLLLTICLSLMETTRLAIPRVYFNKGQSQTFYDAESAMARTTWSATMQLVKPTETGSQQFVTPEINTIRDSKVTVTIRDVNALINISDATKLKNSLSITQLLELNPDLDAELHISNINEYTGKGAQDLGQELDFKRESSLLMADEITMLPAENMLTGDLQSTLKIPFQHWAYPVVPSKYMKRRTSKPSFYHSIPEIVALQLGLTEEEDVRNLKLAYDVESSEIANTVGDEIYSHIRRYYSFRLPENISIMIETDNGFSKSRIIQCLSARYGLPTVSDTRPSKRMSFYNFAE